MDTHSSHRRPPSACLALVVRGTYISRSHGNGNNCRAFLAGYHTQGDDSRLKYTPSFHVEEKEKVITKKRKAPAVLELQPAGQVSGLPHIKRLETRDMIFALTMASIQLARTSQKGAYKLIQSPSFFNY